MYSDDRLVLQLLSLMKQFGIRRVVISPGSRHYPLVHSMENDDFFIMYSVVDERSAAFFALGLIQQSGEPVAVCCTSGTSVVNYGSAVVEAYYQGLPLVVLSADRLPELLGQKEEQVFRQHDVYEGFIRYQGQLKIVRDSLSEWYCNRVINEAFLELDHHGRGPVHLNYPIESHHLDRFQTPALPQARKIARISADVEEAVWASYAARLEGKKVLIVWGQTNPMSDSLRAALDLFAERFNCAILTDKLANCHHPRAVESAYLALHSMNDKQMADLAPDIVISLFGNYTFNGELKGYLKFAGEQYECWDIGRSEVCDPFQRLTTIFEMNEAFFFRTLARHAGGAGSAAYFEGWSQVEATIVEPDVPFGEIYAIGKLMHSLPEGAALQIANSLPIRITHLFKSDPSIRSFCNRGVNGIDGCMSTAVGFAAATDEPVFLVIGDLTFFYDMNALWNRHLSPNLRILLVNNQGGGVMHLPLADSLAPQLTRHVSAGHVTSGRGWAESLGIRYYSAETREETDAAIALLTDPAEPGPIVIEVFSRKEDDVREFKKYLYKHKTYTFKEKVKGKLKRVKGRLERELPGVFRRFPPNVG
ncbi:2-succinyl-5-enolpyruvyl-6-hydroxy-3-cyclohexene-1-carboxylic-acid synthase [Ancylobacter terrae]|uniref:2-succinyl-5-enolpyruvyl-6-hydroxy-3- cyclohexene-1-carboxylic-acid synthase n=1 Tax=Ancylobacter sp. sgz301288 TaxID=3342077 RepID=UPI00385F01F1